MQEPVSPTADPEHRQPKCERSFSFPACPKKLSAGAVRARDISEKQQLATHGISAAQVAAVCAVEILGLAGYSLVPALLPQFLETWGPPYNPWDATAHRSPGGSSSGAGVSLLEGSAFLALGSDTAGSVRIPASMTGNVGLKVTLGRWSAEGVVPLSKTFDTPGLLGSPKAGSRLAKP
jgi:amidase